MMFSQSIRALLDTYANCISLLKAFGRAREMSGEEDTGRQHARLRKSLKSDRSLIERAYSSKASESGSCFKKGDARATKALDRVLKRLRAAIAGLLRLSDKKDAPVLDYESLMSLSNASRADAIKAIDGLSRRLGTPSRSSLVSTSTTRARPKGSTSRKRTPAHDDAAATFHKPQTEGKQRKPGSKKPPPSTKPKHGNGKKRKGNTESPQGSKPQSSLASPRSSEHRSLTPKSPGDGARTAKTAGFHRISILSFSSDSTKLGEVPPKKWQSVVQHAATDPTGDGDQYNVRPTFPLKPYTVEVKERSFWGLFSRKRQG